MRLGLVIGTVTATVKHKTLQGTKLLIVQPQLADGVTADGEPLVAVDAVGAGCGETVMMIRDGLFAREWLKTDASPVRWIIVGIKD